MMRDLIDDTAGVRGSLGEGGSAVLPIFRTPVVRSYRVGTVHDQRRNSLAVAGGRPRTNANERE